MKWNPLSPNAQFLTYELTSDPRYQIRAEWVLCYDGINRRQYRAFFNNCVIGALRPCSSREALIADMDVYIAAGGAEVTRDVPDATPIAAQEAEA